LFIPFPFPFYLIFFIDLWRRKRSSLNFFPLSFL
jgi:hypothetical protein